MLKILFILFATYTLCLPEISGVDENPTNSSCVFDLAQSYAKNCEYSSAIENYKKRIAMGGNEEEIFWSMYSLAGLQEKLQLPYETVVDGYTKAYQYNPTRAEPLYRLAVYFRNSGNSFLGYLVSQFALSIGLPQANLLYCEPWVYDYASLVEFSNCAFLIGNYGKGYEACIKLLGNPDLPPDIRDAIAINKTANFEKLYPVRFEGFFEEFGDRRLDLVAKYLPKNPVIFEAGGHYGNDTVLLAKKWPNAKIVSFEPNPNAFKVATETTKELPHIQRVNLALNTSNGKAKMNLSYGPTGDQPWLFEGASSLLEASDFMKPAYQGPVIEVPCVLLDDWCEENKIEHFDFMWLDLEGMELQVLQSSPKILSKVKVIYTETNFQKFRVGTTQYKDLKAFLENAGFKLLAHWYNENFQGDAIFVRKEIFEKMATLLSGS